MNSDDPSGKERFTKIPQQKGYSNIGQTRFDAMLDVILGIRASQWPKGSKEQKFAEQFIRNWKSLIQNSDCFKITPIWIVYRRGERTGPTAQFALDAALRSKTAQKAGKCSAFLLVGHSAVGTDLVGFQDFVSQLPNTSRLGVSACMSAAYNDVVDDFNQLKGCTQFEDVTTLTELVEDMNIRHPKELAPQLKELCDKCLCKDNTPKTHIEFYIYFSNYAETGVRAARNEKLGSNKTFSNFSFNSWGTLVK